MNFFENFPKVKVLIVGDVMIDRYWWGDVERISPEAPVPIVNLKRTTANAGGAANVAANVAGLGAKPYLFGIIGDDEEGQSLPSLLEKSNVSADFLLPVKDYATTIKTRIIAHQQQITRIDRETKKEITAATENKLLAGIFKIGSDIDIIIVSDYAKGVVTKNLLKHLIEFAAEKNIKILIDPKGKEFARYAKATLLTPNRMEIAEAVGQNVGDQTTLEDAGKNLLKKLHLQNLLVTQGEDGMTLFEINKPPVHLPATARAVFDVTGAGDTVIACLATALGGGATILEAAELANTAAGLVVEQVGTTTISMKMLEDFQENQSGAKNE